MINAEIIVSLLLLLLSTWYPNFFLAGAGWQTAALIAEKIQPAYSVASLGQRTAFAFLTGFGGAVGVCAGNMISHAIK